MIFVSTSAMSSSRRSLLRLGDGRSLRSLRQPHRRLHVLALTARAPHSLGSKPPLAFSPAFPSYSAADQLLDGPMLYVHIPSTHPKLRRPAAEPFDLLFSALRG